MKKVLLIIMILLLTIGCNKEEEKKENNVENKEEIKEIEEKEEEIPVYQDNNPITVGLYHKGKLVKEYNTKFKDRMDIATFNIVFTNEENLGSTNVKNNWTKYYNNYENIDDYKIGFEISMEANGEKLENILLNPSNQHKLHPYLYAYLYDSLHASGKHTHLTMKDIKDNTVFTSIKLYLHQKTSEITSPITLTVFTYKDDNDFIDGHYHGNSKYTITINNK